ncbi:ATP-binding protein [Gemmatimonas phototrophica]|uniref:histidine kinase n=1 Tax=Gemmatimonas phototrophica TaxID=1379270 RepID=A0A143BFT5_9BACT|nr:ATP-binding protein [Gemmatimonas phototrophica]AMW03877.1 hypothetical protein GEMMAAP_01510 [Gemmatimonas phototrophica]
MKAVSRQLRRVLEWIARPEGSPLEAWRQRILAALLLGVCVFGFMAYAVGVSVAVANGVFTVVIVDTLVYGLVVLITVARRWPYALRAGALVCLPALLGLFFLYNFGFVAAGFPWLLCFPIFASVLLGVGAGFWAVGVTTAILLTLGLIIPLNVMPWTAATPFAAPLWWVSSASVITLGALVAISAGYLFDGLAREATARRAAEVEADRRERLAALGTLTGGIAHDFNNLLQPIVSSAEYARRTLAEGHEAHTLLDDILITTSRARLLVRRILSFARPPQGLREIVDLGTLVGESERLLRAVLPSSVALHTNVMQTAHIMAEPAELQQVLLNLVTNASHAMQDGGVVTITVDVRLGGEDLHDTLLEQADRVVVLTVSDTGIGMSSDTLARVFEPFFTTKRPGHGTGLGLATVHATVTGLGGVMRGESTLGVGTRMAVLLPAVAPASAVATQVASHPPIIANGPAQHILVVDDEPAVLRATSRLIERLGYQVTRFATPEELLQAFDTLTPAPAMVLTDLSMPVLSGWEVAAQVHARRPALPVLVMTGNLDPGETAPEGHPGVSGILSKPFTTPELRAMLQQCLGG